MDDEPKVARFDYDDEVFRSGLPRSGTYGGCILRDEYRDVYPRVADGLLPPECWPVLDMGCGVGRLGVELEARGVSFVGVDRSWRQLAEGTGPRTLGEATLTPFRDGTFGAVAALYFLYHFQDPLEPMREAARVLRPGGTFVCCAPSRSNHPELQEHLPPEPASTFDAESAPALVAAVFKDVTVEPWDMLLYRLASSRDVWEYLVTRQTPPEDADRAAKAVSLPLWVRARGAVVWGRKAR